MIHQLARDLAVHLHGRGYPVSVYCGPERVTREGVSSHVVVLERDRERGDSVTYPAGSHPNARVVRVRSLGVVATIRAQSTRAGAMRHEHERECDALVDGVIASLCALYSAAKRPPLDVTEARMLTAEEVQQSEVAPLAVYRMRFALPRAVERRDYDGSARPVAVLAGGETNVLLALPDEEFEVV